jgi:rhamnogalacturonan endolyase
MNTLVKLLGLAALVGVAPVAAAPVADAPSSKQPKSFLKELGNSTWVIGNEIWNVTQNRQYANQLWYKGIDRVGEAVGHYVSYSTLKSTSLITFQHPCPQIRKMM